MNERAAAGCYGQSSSYAELLGCRCTLAEASIVKSSVHRMFSSLLLRLFLCSHSENRTLYFVMAHPELIQFCFVQALLIGLADVSVFCESIQKRTNSRCQHFTRRICVVMSKKTAQSLARGSSNEKKNIDDAAGTSPGNGQKEDGEEKC